jgi:outer membrane biosynthesis protein TonB
MIEILLVADRMLSVGMIDRAEHLFTQVAEADPKNAIAVVGLARVALQRGDESGAMETARAALDIDPDNVAARRLLERLEGDRAPRAAAVVAGVPEASPTAEPQPAPEVSVEPATAPPPEAKPAAALQAELAPTPEPPPRRSWIDRLLGLFGRR